MELNTALEMMHGILVGLDRSPRNPSDRCKLQRIEMPRVQWEVMQGRDSRHKQGRDKTLPSKDESEARSMTSDDRCSADAKRQKSKRDCEAPFSFQKVPKLFHHIEFFNTCMKY